MRVYRRAGPEGAAACVLVDGRLAPIGDVAPALEPADPGDLDEVVQAGRLPQLAEALSATPRRRGRSWPRVEDADLLPPLVRPPKIWCIGLNYRAHAADLDAAQPDEPVGFMRPARSLVGPGATIRLPRASGRVTGEGELAIVLGRTASEFGPEAAPAMIGALTLAVDMTAEDILRRNPRFLTRAKSFDTFLSLGPCLVAPDEVAGGRALAVGGLDHLHTRTLLGGRAAREAPVANMRHSPERLLSFFSRDMTWSAGDILLTGTPGAVPIRDGDTVGAEVSGIGRLENPVRGPRDAPG